MQNWKRYTLAAAGALGLVAFAAADAEAHGRSRGRRTVVVRHAYPSFGLGFYYGPYYGFHPFYAPHLAYGHRPEGGVEMGYAMMAGFGALDLDVKPGQAEVWVDGEFFGEARDLDGSPSFLWLEAGPHRVTIYKGGYVTFDERIDVQRGARKDLKVRMEKGQSAPPPARGPAPVG